MKLVDWARRQGISYRTAQRRFHAGTLGVPATQGSNRRIVVHVPEDDCHGACLAALHVKCLVEVVIAELRRRGDVLDSQRCGAAP